MEILTDSVECAKPIIMSEQINQRIVSKRQVIGECNGKYYH